MGAKSTKHKDTSDGGEASPSPRKSPKRSSSRSASRSSSREGFTSEATTPTRPASDRPEFTVQRLSESPVKGGRKARRSRPSAEKELEKVSQGDSAKHVSKTSGKHRDSVQKEAHAEPMDTNGVEKENIPTIKDGEVFSKVSSSPCTPLKHVEDSQAMEPVTPLAVDESCISSHIPQATSTPAANGFLPNGGLSPDSDADHTDQSDDEAFTSSDQQLKGMNGGFRSASPSTISLTSQVTMQSHSKRALSDSLDWRQEPNFGKFFTSSYLLDGKTDYLKRASINPISNKKPQKSPHFHRPPNFSYSNTAPDYLKRKSKSGMEQLATGTKIIVRRTRRTSSPTDLKNEEAIRMSMFPGGKPPKPNEMTKIEREDWPGPPSPAAILPELMKKRRKSRGEPEDDDDDEATTEDPKIEKEIEELSKLKDTSGIGSIMYKELEVLKHTPKKPLDPWKSSRVPSANHEPKYQTRFQSPMFASPSRFLDRPKRSWDDHDINRGYRTISNFANFPTPKPGYGTYTMTPRATTLPVTGLYGGPVYSYRYLYDLDDDSRQRPSAYASSSTVNTDHGSRSHVSSIHDGPGLSLLTLQRSTWHAEIDPPIYDYERLKISNFDLPKDVDRNMLEVHLENKEFEDIFKMHREEFYKLAEWKRNDIKRKVDLF